MISEKEYVDTIKESKYHCKRLHPVRFEFLITKMSVKEQESLKQFLSSELNCEIRVKRENRKSIFMSSEKSNKKAIKYCFDNFTELHKRFVIDEFELDLSKIQ